MPAVAAGFIVCSWKSHNPPEKYPPVHCTQEYEWVIHKSHFKSWLQKMDSTLISYYTFLLQKWLFHINLLLFFQIIARLLPLIGKLRNKHVNI